jgi:prolipoprotein diacylglyceryltransferase
MPPAERKLAAILYAPARFFLDPLRIADATYSGLTPGQWFCLPSFAIGLWAWRRSRRPAD